MIHALRNVLGTLACRASRGFAKDLSLLIDAVAEHSRRPWSRLDALGPSVHTFVEAQARGYAQVGGRRE